ncbi:MAG: D-xylose ABC transporter ATP-binding protein, partial [Chloroflexi bacterium]
MVETILEMRNVSKRFPGVQALQDVSFDVRRGEIHALVGQNGAGKSTLLKILAGIYTADTGEIVINGEQATDWGPREVLDHGVSFIYQELNLVPDMTVAQNIMLGREPKAVLGTINWRVLRQRARQALERIGDTTIDVSLPLRQLSVAQQQMVAISRALDQNPGLLVLDEPTSRLSIEEVDRLFALLDGVRAREIAVIYVSHRLEEVYRVADRVTVLRDGRRIATTPTKELPPETLVQQMIGSQVREVTQAKV